VEITVGDPFAAYAVFLVLQTPHLLPLSQQAAVVSTSVAVLIPEKSPAPASTESEIFYPVVKVLDGDTIAVMKTDTVVKVRLIGLNTPEIYDNRKPAECFGKEAARRAREMLEGQKVRIESDPSQDRYDKYGRLLGYVFLQNGTSVNEQQIREGYGYEYTYRLPYKYQKEFKAAQREAQKEERGLWKSGVCSP